MIVDLGMAGAGNSCVISSHATTILLTSVFLFDRKDISPVKPAIYEVVNDDTHGFMLLTATNTTLRFDCYLFAYIYTCNYVSCVQHAVPIWS